MKRRTFGVCLLMGLAAGLLPVASAARADEAKKPDTVVPAPRDGGWMKRHEAINANVAKGEVDLLFLGDSITDAWSGPGKEAWKHYYAPRNAVNAGIGGDRTQHVLWRLQNGNLKGITPKLAVLMIGTNNSGSNTSEEIAAGVTAIVDYLQEQTPETKILVLAIFPRGENPANRQRQVNEGANQIIAKLAERPGVTYQDIGGVFLDEQGNLAREVMPDLLHLNPASYGKWAEAIEPNVSKLFGDTPVAPPVTAAAQ